jgi:hypothetical protein
MSSPTRVKTGCVPVRTITYRSPGAPPLSSGVAFALQADALAVARPGLDAELDRLGPVHDAFAVASGAGVGDAA